MSSTDPNAPGENTAVAMVATSSTRLPDANAIIEAAALLYATPGEPPGAFFINGAGEAVEPQWENGKLVFALGDAHVAVTFMPRAIPWSQIEGPCAGAWWWRDATRKMRDHTHHFLVAVIGGPVGPVERRVILTHVVSAVLRGTDAVGVYWAEATIVHEPKSFLDQAASVTPKKIPGPLWLDVIVQQNLDGSYRCYTTGLEPLGFREIELEQARVLPVELISFLGNVATHIVNERRTFKAGEKVARTRDERYTVGYGPSMVGRGEVMRLERVTGAGGAV